MNPAADVLALAIDRGRYRQAIEVGQAITVKWRGKPVFIRHRTPEEIKAAEDVQRSPSCAIPQTDKPTACQEGTASG